MVSYLLYAALLALGYYCTPNIINQILLFTFLYVDYSLRSLFNPVEFPPVTKSQYAHSFAKEVGYSLGQHYALPLKNFDLTIAGKPDSDTAILLIHGFSRSHGDWYWLRSQFQDTNSWVFTVNLTPKLGAIDDIARQSLIPKIQEIKNQTGCKNIILVGASMGGLVASYYKEYLDTDKDIKGVITVGSPLHGTRVAVAAPGLNSRQMCPESEFLKELRNRMRNNPQHYYQVCSKFDEIVFPWESALLPETPSSQQLIMPFTGHLSMLHDSTVVAQLNTWIKKIQADEKLIHTRLDAKTSALLFRARDSIPTLRNNAEADWHYYSRYYKRIIVR